MVWTDDPLQGVAGFRAPEDVGVGAADAQTQGSDPRLGTAAEEHGAGFGIVDTIDHPGPDIAAFDPVPGALDARGHESELQPGHLGVEADPVKGHVGHGEGSQVGDEIVAHNEAVAPIPVAVAGHDDVVEDGTEHVDVLENRTAVLKVWQSALVPGEEGIAGGEIVAEGAVKALRPMGIGKGVIGVVSEWFESEIAVGWSLVPEKMPGGDHLG